MKTSIIMTTYDPTELMCKITSAVIATLNKHTDRDDYEFILVENVPKTSKGFGLNYKEHKITIDKHIVNEENIGCSAGNQQGYEASDKESKYICFMHNDIFVEDNWLPRLRRWIDDGYDVVYPMQGPISRSKYKQFRDMPFEELKKENGNDDGGLVFMSREAYEKSGGWRKEGKYLYHDRLFRLGLKGLKFRAVPEPVVMHIGGAAIFAENHLHRAKMAEEAPIVEKIINKEFK